MQDISIRVFIENKSEVKNMLLLMKAYSTFQTVQSPILYCQFVPNYRPKSFGVMCNLF